MLSLSEEELLNSSSEGFSIVNSFGSMVPWPEMKVKDE